MPQAFADDALVLSRDSNIYSNRTCRIAWNNCTGGVCDSVNLLAIAATAAAACTEHDIHLVADLHGGKIQKMP